MLNVFFRLFLRADLDGILRSFVKIAERAEAYAEKQVALADKDDEESIRLVDEAEKARRRADERHSESVRARVAASRIRELAGA
jgi:hypothetical protein